MKWFLPDEHVLAADFALVHGVVPVNPQERRLVEEHFAKVHHRLPKFMSRLFLLDRIGQLESEVEELRQQLYEQSEETADLRSELIRHAMLIDLLVRRLEVDRRYEGHNAEEEECENQVQEILFRRRLELAKLELPEEYDDSKRQFGSNRESSDGHSQQLDNHGGVKYGDTDRVLSGHIAASESELHDLEATKYCNQQPEMSEENPMRNPKKRMVPFGSGDADTLSSSIEGVQDMGFSGYQEEQHCQVQPI